MKNDLYLPNYDCGSRSLENCYIILNDPCILLSVKMYVNKLKYEYYIHLCISFKILNVHTFSFLLTDISLKYGFFVIYFLILIFNIN